MNSGKAVRRFAKGGRNSTTTSGSWSGLEESIEKTCVTARDAPSSDGTGRLFGAAREKLRKAVESCGRT
jgi:hypothetical protein